MTLRAHAGRVARPALGAQRRGPGGGPLARRAHCRGEGARFPGRRPGGGRCARGGRQALLRLRRGHRGARLRLGRHLRANVTRSAHAAVRGGGCFGRGGRHARLHGPRGNSDDGEQGAAARLAARPLGVQGRDRQRLQCHCGAHASRHRPPILPKRPLTRSRPVSIST